MDRFRRLLTSGTALLLSVLALGGVEAVGISEHYEFQEIHQIQQQQVALDSKQQAIEKSEAQVEQHTNALDAVLKHSDHDSHLPGSVCVCIRGYIPDFQSKICEIADQCGETEIKACQIIHKGFTCRPSN